MYNVNIKSIEEKITDIINLANNITLTLKSMRLKKYLELQTKLLLPLLIKYLLLVI